jgi:cell division protein ZapE
MPAHLTDRRPELGADELVTALVPPPRFDAVRFETYLPNPDEPSQAAAVEACSAFAAKVGVRQEKKRFRLFGGPAAPSGPMGL